VRMHSDGRPGLVILDCDGVLVDSEHLLIDVRQEMLGELGISISRADLIGRFVGTPHREFVAEVELLIGGPLPDTWDEDYQRRCRLAFDIGLTPVPGILDALDALTVPTCVASSGSHDKMAHTLAITGLLSRFEGRIYSATEVPRGKPYPDLFLHAAQAMGFAPGDCIVVEDSAAGVTAALAAGMAVIAYAAGVTPKDQLERPGVIVIDDMTVLPSAIEDARRR